MYKKILIISFVMILLIVMYGIVSNAVFKKDTFLSYPVDCMPRTYEGRKIDREITLSVGTIYVKLFGTRCVSY